MKTMINIRLSTVVGALFITASALAGIQGAQAGGIDGVPTKTVAYGDLNLDSSSGAKVFYGRLRGAARWVCSEFEGRRKSAWQSCYDNAIASAVAKVNKTAVTQVHEDSVGRPHAS